MPQETFLAGGQLSHYPPPENIPLSMPSLRNQVLGRLRSLARDVAAAAHAPYSSRKEGAVVLLSDGAWVPGTRVESASFSLTIQAVRAAFCTSIATRRTDAVALVLSRPATLGEQAYLTETPLGRFVPVASDGFVLDGAVHLPDVGARVDPFLIPAGLDLPGDAIRMARDVAQGAIVPASHFPVGCVLQAADGRMIPGVNVEATDWAWILCAERTALCTAVAYGTGAPTALYLTCLRDRACTPCGACRQLLVELAPNAVLWMDRGDQNPAAERVGRLLPGSFVGSTLGAPSDPLGASDDPSRTG